MKRIIAFALIGVLAIGMSPGVFAEVLARREIKVRVNVPVMQQMEVIRPAVVEFDLGDLSGGAPLVFENVGGVRIRSNANWSMSVRANTNVPGIAVYVRRSGQRWEPWQLLTGENTVFGGQRGMSDVSWDLKVESLQQVDVYQVGGFETGRVELLITLGK